MMKKYYDNINDKLKEYFKILSPEFPEWLNEYIDTPEMERIRHISAPSVCYKFLKLKNVIL